MKSIKIKDVIHEFYCPYTNCGNLTVSTESENNFYITSDRDKQYRIIGNIIEFCSQEKLIDEPHKARESQSTDKTMGQYQSEVLPKHRPSDYALYVRKQKLALLTRELFKNDISTLVFLGAGGGAEIRRILEMDRGKKIKKVFASDLSLSACQVISSQLSEYDVELILFNSDLDYCPVKNKNYPIVVYDALHHTPEMHQSIAKLLQYGYNNIHFVEPADNLVITILEKFGLARREEYSGCIPGRLRLNQLKMLAKQYQYKYSINTYWVFPRDYYQKIFRQLSSNSFVQRSFLTSIDRLSDLTNVIKVGNYAIVHLEKQGDNSITQ